MGETSTDGTNVEGEAPRIEPTVETDEATYTDDAELERTLGLTGGLAIGIGTMIGAGIFVFPGLAAEQAGPAASVSFAIGAVVALLVALPASELATAMPKSGGGYYFISRGLGTLAGTVVGLSLWFGLVFATAFYLVGFGYYAVDTLAELGIAVGEELVIPIALLFGAGFTVLNVTGTENAAKLQNGIVALLVSILVVFLTYGGLDAAGVVGEPSVPEQFAPAGIFPIFTTAALVFTSYLGFAQVATVAGEMKDPGRNLPLAMVGSVLVVGVLYVVTIFVATSGLGSEALGDLRETAMVEVGRHYLGPVGAVAIVFGGLLATMSSANASVLSTSRSIYAVSRDALLPQEASRINLRYGTPHVALGMAGGPILVLTATGKVELLAEVASFLHLIMYGLICVALIALRRDEPEWYDPDFRVPGYPVVPALGAVCSFALILFMHWTSQLIGVGIMILTTVWYFYYARDVDLKGKL
ncbi:APC family permease [Natronobacterium gregoryi]|uniref:Amino acid permease n=2 Tax=Natronobacterium gregoryi TaxID=44930 RepID=L0AI36_NATGS|nr:APC family permease [Natronobacterium gregoryi]AFZ73568.1 amino acid transporter [Natronobacterium gregoryi SP2]ELY68235.1 amino acid permease [Natronobacterium gregoryi SP2]PLK20533.1 amino acid permease [Natronobacterium gregoryi SP2]SFJ17890.1 amino acid/polyamine/organocation transporter, APC superfamily [Natronobacterium gregoryi]